MAIGRDFDQMGSRLENLRSTGRRLFHDVSHELRSPLARLQAATGVLRQNPARLADMLPRFEQEVGKLDNLMAQILTLARIESTDLSPADLQWVAAPYWPAMRILKA